MVNRVIEPLNELLKNEPSHKYLDVLNEDDLPTNSDVVLIISQYEKALLNFKNKYFYLIKITQINMEIHGRDGILRKIQFWKKVRKMPMKMPMKMMRNKEFRASGIQAATSDNDGGKD